MILRLLTASLAALSVFAPLITSQAGVASKSKWEREFKFGRNDALAIQVFRIKDGKPAIIADDTFKLTGSGYTTVAGRRVKLGGLNMFSALASLEGAFRRDSFTLGLETKAQISKQNGREIVFIYGEVLRPGIVTIEDDATVADLIEAAGGLKKSANLERVTVIQNGITMPVDSPNVADTKVKAGAVVKISRGLMRSGSAKRRFEQIGSDDPKDE